MKLYPKQLHSLEELKREQHVLKYAAKHTDDWLSLKELGGSSSSTDNAAGAGILGTVISAFGSKSIFNVILAIAPPVMTLLSRHSSSSKKRKNPLESLAKELIIGYVKWKAVQLAYRGVRNVFRHKGKESHE